MKKFYVIIICLAIGMFLDVNPVRAVTVDVPTTIFYQGHIVDADGLDVNGEVAIEVRLYDSLIAGLDLGVENVHVVYAELHPVVAVEKGNFSISVGNGTRLDAKWEIFPFEELISKESIYLELWINGERLGPRQRMGAAPSALRAHYTKYADHLVNNPTVTAEMMPAYDAAKIYGTLDGERIPNLDVSRFDGVLNLDHIPLVAPSSFSSNGTLSLDLFSELSATLISEGFLSPDRFSTNVLRSSDIALSAGTLLHEEMLNFPSGFTDSECRWSISFSRTVGGSVEGINDIKMYLNNDHVFTCLFRDHDDPWKKCSANYLIMCKRGGV